MLHMVTEGTGLEVRQILDSSLEFYFVHWWCWPIDNMLFAGARFLYDIKSRSN